LSIRLRDVADLKILKKLNHRISTRSVILNEVKNLIYGFTDLT